MRVLAHLVIATGFILLLAGCAPGNFFCKGKGTLTTAALMYNATVTGDCGEEGFLFSKGAKSLPLPKGLAPETATTTPPTMSASTTHMIGTRTPEIPAIQS